MGLGGNNSVLKQQIGSQGRRFSRTATVGLDPRPRSEDWFWFLKSTMDWDVCISETVSLTHVLGSGEKALEKVGFCS